ncbi:MAG: hypothetical protein H0V41_04570 [Pseudonocardiales bacterium]|nr:hypothetical protein [Pseudonocardiales bacterium]
MVNRRMKPAQVLTLIRKLGRQQHGLTIEELPKRGKGSHRICVLADAEGKEVGRFGLTGHARDLSWKVLGSTEGSLAHLFGENWTEGR